MSALRQKTHVLVVDGLGASRSALVDLLREEGYLVEAADNRAEAERLIRGHVVDVVLLDLGRPRQELLDLIEEIEAERDPPAVVVMSARGAERSAARSLGGHVSGHLVKPIHLAQLFAAIDRAFSERAIGDHVAALA